MTKILVIDDEISICRMMKMLFDKKGYKTIYAVTGKEGLDKFQTEEPGIVILDMYLGDISGLEVLEKIKAKDRSCHVIVITASPSEDNKRQAFELGAEYYLSKPFSIEELNNILLSYN